MWAVYCLGLWMWWSYVACHKMFMCKPSYGMCNFDNLFDKVVGYEWEILG